MNIKVLLKNYDKNTKRINQQYLNLFVMHLLSYLKYEKNLLK